MIPHDIPNEEFLKEVVPESYKLGKISLKVADLLGVEMKIVQDSNLVAVVNALEYPLTNFGDFAITRGKVRDEIVLRGKRDDIITLIHYSGEIKSGTGDLIESLYVRDPSRVLLVLAGYPTPRTGIIEVMDVNGCRALAELAESRGGILNRKANLATNRTTYSSSRSIQPALRFQPFYGYADFRTNKMDKVYSSIGTFLDNPGRWAMLQQLWDVK